MQTHDEAEVAGAAPRRASQKQAEADKDISSVVADPGRASPESLLRLQRLAGNASVSRMMSGSDEEPAAARSPVLDVVGRGGGQPLDDGLRGEMEARLGSDFGDVRVHTGAGATESAESVGANAYTVGDEVVFRSDQWSPSTDQGKKTLAHELSHVVQQRTGPVEGTSVGGGIRVSDPGDRFERAADQVAEAAMTAGQPTMASAMGSAPTAQRQTPEEEEEEQLQGEFVQRQAPEEEEEEQLQGEFVQRQAPEEEEEEPVAG